METGLQVVGLGALIVTSLLLRNAAARHVTPEMVPSCLQGRLHARNRMAPAMLALSTAVTLAGMAVLVALHMGADL